MNIIKTVALCSALMLLAFISASMDSDLDIERMEDRIYCENVDVWNQYIREDGGSDYGHPDYKGIYQSTCNLEVAQW